MKELFLLELLNVFLVFTELFQCNLITISVLSGAPLRFMGVCHMTLIYMLFPLLYQVS